jgi:hypothetical protein
VKYPEHVLMRNRVMLMLDQEAGIDDRGFSDQSRHRVGILSR